MARPSVMVLTGVAIAVAILAAATLLAASIAGTIGPSTIVAPPSPAPPDGCPSFNGCTIADLEHNVSNLQHNLTTLITNITDVETDVTNILALLETLNVSDIELIGNITTALASVIAVNNAQNISINTLEINVAAIGATQTIILADLSSVEAVNGAQNVTLAAHAADILALQNTVVGIQITLSDVVADIDTLTDAFLGQNVTITAMLAEQLVQNANIASLQNNLASAVAVNEAQNVTLAAILVEQGVQNADIATLQSGLASAVAVNGVQNTSITTINGQIVALQATDQVILAILAALNGTTNGTNFTSLTEILAGVQMNVTVIQDLLVVLPPDHGGTGTATIPGNDTILYGDGSGNYAVFNLLAGANVLLTRQDPNLTISTSLTPSFTTATITSLTNTNGVVYADSGGLLAATVAGAAGTVLQGRGGGLAPIFAALVAGDNVIISTGAGLINISTSLSPGFTDVYVSSLAAALNGALYAGTSGRIQATVAGTNGQVLQGRTGAGPIFAALTAGTNAVITPGNGSITIGVSATPSFTSVTVTSLTNTNGVVYADTGGLLAATAFGASGTVLQGRGSGTAPIFAALIAGDNVIISTGAGIINISTSLSPVFTDVFIGSLSASLNGALYAGTSGRIQATVAGTNGQVLQGRNGAGPIFAALTAGTNMVVTPGNGSITLATSLTPSFTSVTVTSLTNTNGVVYVDTGGLLAATAVGATGTVLQGRGAGTSPIFTATPSMTSVTISGNSANAFLYSDASKGVASVAWSGDGQLLISRNGNTPLAATLTDGLNMVISEGAGSITVATTSTPTFTSATLTAVSNQLVLGTTNTITFSVSAPSTSRTITFADPGGAASVLYDVATQTITGTKLFRATASTCSSNYAIGTAGTGGISSVSVAGVSTVWNGFMQGGMILFTATGTPAFIKKVASPTSLTVETAITISAGSAYILYYGCSQAAQGDLNVQSLYVGSQNVTINTINRVMILGNDNDLVAGSGPQMAFLTGADGYALLSIAAVKHATTVMCFDCSTTTTPGTYQSSSSTRKFLMGTDAVVSGSFFIASGAVAVGAGSTFTPQVELTVSGSQVSVIHGFAVEDKVITFGTAALGSISLAAAVSPPSEWTYNIPDLGAGADGSDLVITKGTQTLTGTKNLQSLGWLASSTASSTTAGTVSTAGVSNTILTGTSTSFTGVEKGGVITITSTGETGYVTQVLSSTSIRVAAAMTVTAGSAYTIRHSAIQMAQGYVGMQGLDIGNVNKFATPLQRVNIFGTDGATNGTAAAVNFFTGADAYPLMQLYAGSHGTQILCFDCGVVSGASTPQIVLSSVTSNWLMVAKTALSTLSFAYESGLPPGSITGLNTFNSVLQLSFTAATLQTGAVMVVEADANQYVGGLTNTVTLNLVAPSAPRIISFQDVGSNTDVFYTGGTQTASGLKNFQSLGLLASSTSTIYNTGTVSTSGSSVTITGAGGAVFTAGMRGGTIYIPATGVFAFIVNVPAGGSTLTVAVAVTISAGATYVLSHTNFGAAQGYLGAQGLYIPVTNSQIVFGGANAVTLTVAPSTTAGTVTLPDTGITSPKIVQTDNTATTVVKGEITLTLGDGTPGNQYAGLTAKAWYQQIGDGYYWTANIAWTGNGSVSGIVKLGGFPAALASPSTYRPAGNIQYFDGIVFSKQLLLAADGAGKTYLVFVDAVSGAGGTVLTNTAFKTAGNVNCAGYMRVA